MREHVRAAAIAERPLASPLQACADGFMSTSSLERMIAVDLIDRVRRSNATIGATSSTRTPAYEVLRVSGSSSIRSRVYVAAVDRPGVRPPHRTRG